MRTFHKIPFSYRSDLIAAIKKARKAKAGSKKDFEPTLLDFGSVQIYLARHFGFCYGVNSAIDLAYNYISENVGKRIFLLGEIIHNPQVNADLLKNGVQFLFDKNGKELIAIETLTPDDVVIIPAFGTTLEIEEKLKTVGIEAAKYETTCEFVEKVWNRGKDIGEKGYSLIVHGKENHEETKATFSHSSKNAPTVIVNNLQETVELGKYITGEKHASNFYSEFKGRYSNGFDPTNHLQRIGVINQTTQLYSDTLEIAEYLKQVMINHYKLNDQTIKDHFADNRDTLCYATMDNQQSVLKLLESNGDLAIVVGGYNSSNTSHLVELCERKLVTFYIESEAKILSQDLISHYDWKKKTELVTSNFLPNKNPLKILLTSGASCPDAIVERVIERIIEFYPQAKTMEQMLKEFH